MEFRGRGPIRLRSGQVRATQLISSRTPARRSEPKSVGARRDLPVKRDYLRFIRINRSQLERVACLLRLTRNWLSVLDACGTKAVIPNSIGCNTRKLDLVIGYLTLIVRLAFRSWVELNRSSSAGKSSPKSTIANSQTSVRCIGRRLPVK